MTREHPTAAPRRFQRWIYRHWATIRIVGPVLATAAISVGIWQTFTDAVRDGIGLIISGLILLNACWITLPLVRSVEHYDSSQRLQK